MSVEGIVVKNGSKWGTLIGRSDNVRFDHVKLFQPMFGVGEDDALDIIESQNVTIQHSIGASFDDSFSVKAYSGQEAYISFGGAHEPAFDITIDDCIAWTGCHAFKLGQGIGQTMSSITFKNSVVFDAAHGVSVHRKAGAATIQDVTWDHIDIQKIGQTNLGRSWFYSNIEATGAGNIDGLTISNIRIRDFGTDATSPVRGLSEGAAIHGISFRNLYVGASGQGTIAQNAAEARLDRQSFVNEMQVSQDGVRVFWDRDAVKVEGASDWSPGNYKANCGPGEAASGLSQASTLQGPHALRCKQLDASFSDASASAWPISYAKDAFRSGHTHATYDWDPGHAKSECGQGEYVAGISQAQGGAAAHSLAHLRCARGNVAGNACNSKSAQTDDRGENTGDWDPGFFKAECGAGKLMLGVSVSDQGKPRRILCCNK